MVKINNHSWWIWDTDTVLTAWQFSYWEWIDVTKDPSFITIWPRTTESADLTATNKRAYCSLLSKTWLLQNVFFMWEDGYIYDKNWTIVKSTWIDIVACHQYNISWIDYILWVTDNWIVWRIKVSEAYNSTDWTVETSYNDAYQTVWNWTEKWFHFILFKWGLFLASKNEVWFLSNWWTRTKELDNLDSEIKWLTRNGTMMRIYTEKWYMYLWTWAWNSVDSTIFTGIHFIRWVYSDWGIDWVLWWTTKNSSILYQSNWYQYIIIKKWIELSLDIEKNKFRFFEWSWANNFAVSYYWMIYIAWDDYITQFGKEYPVSPYSFNNTISKNNTWLDLSVATALVVQSDTLYFYYETATTSWIDKLELSSWLDYTRNDTWLLYTQKFMMWNVKRQTVELYVRADVPTNTSIVIAYELDWNWTRSELWTIDNPDITRHILPTTALTFNEIRFKFALNTTDTDTTPKLYEYEFNLLPIQREWQT